MAKKPTITTIASGYYSRQALNNNFTALKDAFDNTLSRDGSTPNTMTADFDLNGQDLLNVKDTYTDNLFVGGIDLNASIAASNAASAAAGVSAGEAAVSADSAAASAVEAALIANSSATLLRNATLVSAGQTAFTLDYDLPLGLVFIDGVQQSFDAYSYTFPTLTFTGTVASGSIVDALFSAGNAAYSLQTFETVANVLADTTFDYNNIGVGASFVTRKEGFAYEVAASGATDQHVTTAGGVKLYVIPIGGVLTDKAFGADGTNFAALQVAVDAAAGLTLLLTVDHAIGANVLSVSNPKTTLSAFASCGITYTTATNSGVTISGDDCEVNNLTINAPATFTAVAGQPTYGVFWITANGVSVHDNTLNNVPKHGIAFDECDSGTVYNNVINGNYPLADYDGLTTLSHSGIRCNPTASGDQGKFIIHGNRISGCVQGVLSGNFGAASRNQGFAVYGNIFTECWNHGIYASSSDSYAWAVTGNTFVRCQKPIALFGRYHVVSGNTLTAGGFSGTSAEFVGISMRDSIGCIVANNTVQGEVEGGGTVINLTQVSGTVVKDNVVSGNVINITGAALGRIIGIGSSTTVDLSNNVVTGNVIFGAAPEFSGLIWFNTASGANARNSVIANNAITMTGACDAIGIVNCVGTKVLGNSIEIKFDAATAKTVPGIKITSCADIDISGNTITCTAAYGANVNLRAIWEQTSGSGSRATANTMRADLTKLVSATKYVTNNASGIIVDDVGAGAPTLNAGVGSRYGRTDGGAGTSFYVKESGTTSAGWVAK